MTKQGDKSAVAASYGNVLHLPALEIRQGPNRRLYTFAVDGKQVPSFAAVSRVRRDSQQQLHGYQRPEVLAHVAAIRRYVESDDSPLLPNAIVVAFDDRVHFIPADADSDADRPSYVRMGTLLVPVSEDWEDADKPGFIVDGQQRCAAIRDAEVPAFPICVTAFITADQADHRSQFILVNSTKPLPKGLIHELLPAASGPLPNQLRVRQLPATVLERLNFEERSPLRHMIQTPTNPTGVIKDNSMLRMLENSISDGVLYRFRGSDGSLPNIGLMVTVLSDFWTAVREVFGEDAWGKPPRKSRLMHGAGIISMGYLMDAIADTIGSGEDIPDVQGFAAGLKTVKDYCRWTEGTWDLGDGIPRRWNDVQNTPRDIQRITDFLVSTYYSKQGKRHDRSSRLF